MGITNRNLFINRPDFPQLDLPLHSLLSCIVFMLKFRLSRNESREDYPKIDF